VPGVRDQGGNFLRLEVEVLRDGREREAAQRIENEYRRLGQLMADLSLDEKLLKAVTPGLDDVVAE
jgi:hypothetical protein